MEKHDVFESQYAIVYEPHFDLARFLRCESVSSNVKEPVCKASPAPKHLPDRQLARSRKDFRILKGNHWFCWFVTDLLIASNCRKDEPTTSAWIRRENSCFEN